MESFRLGSGSVNSTTDASPFRKNRIAVRFAYEWHDDSGNWFRSYGNENWEFEENGLMPLRIASINDLPIKESERRYHWPLARALMITLAE